MRWVIVLLVGLAGVRGSDRFLRERVPPFVGVKASGGIDTFERAVELLDAGADLLGSSAGVAIAESRP